MPVVLVHGVPETAALWDGLKAELGRDDVITLQLPGFGTEVPDGFGATKEDYVAWLVGELEGLQGGEPVDLLGHDWGGGFVVRVVSTRPDLFRSWVTDAAGIGDVNFDWHDFAKIWQTPEEGEKFFADQLAQPVEERAGVFELFAVPHDEAVRLAGWVDQRMVDCILTLYRSAMTVGKEWGPEFQDIAKPGLILVPSDDPFLDSASAEASAKKTGATLAPLPGMGHWWALQDPATAAAVLQQFWGGLD